MPGEWCLLTGPAVATLGAAAALLNLLGYSFDWFHTVSLYVERVHAIASAWLGLLCWVLLRSRRHFSKACPAFASLLGVVMTAGLLWEFFEAWIELIGTRRDTLADLAMDWLGGAAAGLIVLSDLNLRSAHQCHDGRVGKSAG